MGSPRVRWVLLLSLVVTGVMSLPLRNVAAFELSRQPTDPFGQRLGAQRLQIDLPALVPHPADLGRQRVDGGGAGLWTPEHFAAFNQLTLAQAQAMKFVGSYDHALILGAETGRKRQLQQLRTTLVVYGDAAAAAADYVERDPPAGWEWIDSRFSIGEDARVRRGNGDDGSTAWQAIGVEFHVENVVVRFELYEFEDNPANGIPLTTKGLRSIAEKVQDRVAAQLDSPDWNGLQLRLLRLGSEDTVYPILFDDYTVLDGKVMRYFDDTDESYRLSKRGAAQTVDSYLLEQSATVDGQKVYVLPHLARYQDADTAAAVIGNVVDWMQNEDPAFASAEEVSDIAVFGDESVAVRYRVYLYDGSTASGIRIVARFGREVARVDLQGDKEPSWEALQVLAAAQVDCLRAKRCPEPIAFPEV